MLDPSNHPAHGGGAKLAVRPAFAKAPTAPASAWASHGGAVGGGAVAALGGRTLDTAFDHAAPPAYTPQPPPRASSARASSAGRGRGAQFRMEGGQVRRVAPVRPSGGDGGGGRGQAPSWYPASAAEASRAARAAADAPAGAMGHAGGGGREAAAADAAAEEEEEAQQYAASRKEHHARAQALIERAKNPHPSSKDTKPKATPGYMAAIVRKKSSA